MAIKAGGTFLVLENAGTLPVEIVALGESSSRNAERFISFLSSGEARDIWGKWGFETPGGNEADE
jgi:ABC-type molybdate transport system substrate-binding protein